MAAESYTVESVTAESAPAESASESYSEPGSECGTSTLEFDEMLRRGADIDEALRAIGVVLPDTVAVESVREESVKEESREDKLMATLKRAAGIKDDDSASVAFAKCDRAVKYELNSESWLPPALLAACLPDYREAAGERGANSAGG